LKERTHVLSILSDSVKREADRLRAANLADLLSQGEENPRYVAELETLYRSSSCEQIKTLVHRSMINLHLIKKDKEKLLQECVLLYSLSIQATRDPESLSRSASTFIEISKAALHVHSFDSAIEFAKAGLEFTQNEFLMKVDLMENLLIGYLNLNEIDECARICHELDEIYNMTNQLDFRKLRFNYLKCWFLFVSGDHKSVLRTIAQLPQMPKEKIRWHAGFYVLELLSLLELKTFFQLDYKNEAYKKFLVRYGFDKDPVLNFIYRSFKLFIDDDYEFRSANEFISAQLPEGERRDPFGLSVIDLYDVTKNTFYMPRRKMQGLL
jgi:hypothetical protein